MSDAHAAAAAAVRQEFGGSAALAQRLLNVVLFITVLTSCIAFIEPSPHDCLIFVLLASCVAARVPFDPKLVPLLILLMFWMLGAALSLTHVGDDEKAIQYVGTSLYLSIACIMFACLFGDGNSARLTILRRAYIVSALIATAAGYVGYFHLLPGSDAFLIGERVSATFKDPNVYGPFLIFPTLMLMIGLLTRGIRLFDLAVMGALMGGLLLSFSRGAWIHFMISATTCIFLLLIVTRDPRKRARIIGYSAVAVVVVAVLVSGLLSVESIRDMFFERAKLLQSYDVGPGGRFTLQELALTAILEHPNGMGPFEFARVFGLQQHNVYLQCFLVYGWLGGAVYLTLLATTLMVGLRATLISAPWQLYLIAAVAVLIGEMVEGAIVDTDHWRHFFLMIGMIWGLSAASINFARRRIWQPEAVAAASPQL